MCCSAIFWLIGSDDGAIKFGVRPGAAFLVEVARQCDCRPYRETPLALHVPKPNPFLRREIYRLGFRDRCRILTWRFVQRLLPFSFLFREMGGQTRRRLARERLPLRPLFAGEEGQQCLAKVLCLIA